MITKVLSITFLLSSLLLMVLAFPLFAGWVDQNALYGWEGNVPLEPGEWVTLNRAYGAGALAYGSILFCYHVLALWKMRRLPFGRYLLYTILASVISIFPAYLAMKLMV